MERLEKLKKQHEQLTARIQKIEAAERTRERKKDIRRKILIGAYYLEKAKKENSLKAIFKEMDNYLSRDSDRVLFDLEPREKPQTPNEKRPLPDNIMQSL